MKYILNKDYRLRGWTDSIANLEYFPTREITKITPHECLFLMRCDGEREVDVEASAPEIAKYLELGVIRETEGDTLLPEQEYVLYENKFFRTIYLSITGGCDFRCKHCFVAADDNPRAITPTTEEIIDLIKRLDECGIASLWISGGEPLLHKGFLKITEEISRRGMKLETLVTNLYHMTPEIADTLHAQGHNPFLHVSFDGIGYHEWLRGIPGSEKNALEKIKMMREKGFDLQVHYCVWKDSMGAVRDTVLKLQELGVEAVRITSIEPAPRWVESHLDQTITPGEWLDFAENLTEWWISEDIQMSLDIWCFLVFNKFKNTINIIPDMHTYNDKRYKISICPDAYERPYIDCDGRIMTCIGLSGFSDKYGMQWGNVYKDDIHEILRKGPFIDLVTRTVGDLKDAEEECQTCKWKDACAYGCRIEALAQGNGLDGRDERICIFYKEGYYERFKEIAMRHNIKLIY